MTRSGSSGRLDSVTECQWLPGCDRRGRYAKAGQNVLRGGSSRAQLISVTKLSIWRSDVTSIKKMFLLYFDSVLLKDAEVYSDRCVTQLIAIEQNI